MTIYSAAITLFLVMDPLGNIPVFLSLLDHVHPARRRVIIVREMFIALGVLCLSLFFGRYIMVGLQIGEPALGIGGGVVLFIIALRMIFPRPDSSTESAARSDAGTDSEPLVVPLAVPLVAGPSAMAMVILYSTQHPDRILSWLAALLVAWFASAVILLSADVLRRYLGRRVIKAVERLMGMILVTLAVEMFLDGLRKYLAQ